MALRIAAICAMILALAPSGMCDDFKQGSRGRRDPFVPLIGKEKPAVTRLEDVTSIEDVVLEGIAVEAKGKRTIILNGSILKEGGRAGDVEVKKISEKTVTLSIGGKIYDIELSEKGGRKSG